jgi:hypothetical protein
LKTLSLKDFMIFDNSSNIMGGDYFFHLGSLLLG